MRNTLIKYREIKGLPKRQTAIRIGTNAQTYAFLENNKRNGSITMWSKVQKVLDIPDSEMWRVITENE